MLQSVQKISSYVGSILQVHPYTAKAVFSINNLNITVDFDITYKSILFVIDALKFRTLVGCLPKRDGQTGRTQIVLKKQSD